jgi:uncharacterized protein (DUF2147 family)
MTPPRILAVFMLFIIPLASHAGANEADAILGRWNMINREAQFEIYKCGEEYCGKISYLKEPCYPAGEKHGFAGRPKLDLENPDPQLRSRPLLGLPLLEGFRYTGDNTWDEGRIYNPEDGKKYRCKLWLDGQNRLNVRGYIGYSLFGKTEIWVREPCSF